MSLTRTFSLSSHCYTGSGSCGAGDAGGADFARHAILAGMSAYDPEPRRGRTATAVLLAVALLAVLGAAVGYLLGVRYNDSKPQADRSAAASAPAGTPCPDFMQHDAAAQGAVLPLTLRLYVLTKKQNATASDPYRSEIWICAAARASGNKSRLWYQGHSIRTARYPAEQITNDPVNGNGILLGGVNAIDGGKYRATYTDNNGASTSYTVSPDELDINGAGGTSTQEVVDKTVG
jgi:hypothetical protein